MMRWPFGRRRFEADFSAEIESHIALETERLTRSGMTPDDAAHAAHRAFGNLTSARERFRESRGGDRLEQLAQDFRYSLRAMRRSPGFTAVAMLSLAVGTGANTAIFGSLDSLVLRPLAVREPQKLITLEQAFPDGQKQYGFAYVDYERMRDALGRVTTGLSATTWADGYNIGVSGPGANVDEGLARVSIVTGNFFSVMGASARVGRVLSDEDDRVEGGNPVTMISDAYWQRRFARARDVVGRELTLNGTAYTIIGVASAGFVGDWTGWPTDIWVPVAMTATAAGGEIPVQRTRGANHAFRIMGRLANGVPLQRAQAVAGVEYAALQKDPPPASGIAKGARLEVQSAANGYSPQRAAFVQPLTILMAVVALVLIIACTNVANLLLARAAARQREMAIRVAAGASRSRIVRQLLTEGAVLGVCGGALGIVFALWLTSVLSAFARSGPAGTVTLGAQSLVMDVHFSWRTLLFTAGVCVAATLLFALAPALRETRGVRLNALTGRGADTSAAGGRLGPRRALVSVQVALSLILLVGTSLFVRSLRNLQSQDFGFARGGLLQVWTLPAQTGRTSAEVLTMWRAIQDRLSGLPGVVSVSASTEGLVSGAPLAGPALQPAGADNDDAHIARTKAANTVAPRFFATVGQPLIEGREFETWDTDSAPRRIIVNETAAHRMFGTESAVGRHVSFVRSNAPAMEIVGVVRDARVSPRDAGPMIYYPPAQNVRRLLRGTVLAVRVTGDPGAVAALVRRELRAIEPRLPVIRIDTIEEQIADVLFRERFVADLVGLFGIVALALSCAGLYGVVSYTTARRTNEIGVRLALGATRLDIAALVFRESVLMVALGVGTGVPTSIAATRFIASRLYGIGASDPFSLITAAGLLAIVAVIAALLPARRASRVDPMTALRYE